MFIFWLGFRIVEMGARHACPWDTNSNCVPFLTLQNVDAVLMRDLFHKIPPPPPISRKKIDTGPMKQRMAGVAFLPDISLHWHPYKDTLSNSHSILADFKLQVYGGLKVKFLWTYNKGFGNDSFN